MMARYKWIAAIGSMLTVVGCNASPGLMPQVQPLAQSTPQLAAAASQKATQYKGTINAIRANAAGQVMIVRQKGTLLDSEAFFVVSPKTEVLFFDGKTTVPFNTLALPLMPAMEVAIETLGPIRKSGRDLRLPTTSDQLRQAQAEANPLVKLVVMKKSGLLKDYKFD